MGNRQTKLHQFGNKVKKMVKRGKKDCEYIDSTQSKIKKIMSLWMRKNDVTQKAPLDDLATIIAIMASEDPRLIWRAIKRHDLKICRVMISIDPRIVNLVVTTSHGPRPILKIAVWGGTAAIVEAFIDSGHLSTDSIKLLRESRPHPIHLAIDGADRKSNKGAAKMIELLVNQLDFNVNAGDENSFTPLMRATSFGLANIVKTLMNSPLNADVSLLSSDNVSVLHIACRKGHLEILAMFLDDEKISEKLDVNGRTKERGHTPLMYAVFRGHIECVSLLLKQEAIDLTLTDKLGWHILMHAASQGNFEMIKMIVNHAKRAMERDALAKMVNAQWTESGMTALHMACAHNYREIALCLMTELNEWIDISIEDNYGRTALMIAQSEGFGDIFMKNADRFEIFDWLETFPSNGVIFINRVRNS